MYMSETEIVKNYMEAKDKKNQINILKDLNCCTKEEILKVLVNNGIELPEPPKRRGRKPKAENDTEQRDLSGCKNNEGPSIENPYPLPIKPTAEEIKRENSIPQSVRCICEQRVQFLVGEVMKFKKEIDEIKDFLMGVT